MEAMQTKNWFNCKVKFVDKMTEEGVLRTVSESYLVSAVDFTEAEALVAKMCEGCGSYTVDSIRKVRLYDVFRDKGKERFYDCKAAFLKLDEKTGVEKRQFERFVVQADDFAEAVAAMTSQCFRLSMHSEIVSVSEAPYVDVIIDIPSKEVEKVEE